MKNREKILVAAKSLFNSRGFLNVRLQHISDETIISVGNIAYHFKNKQAIIEEIFSELEIRHREALLEYRHVPIFSNLNRVFVILEDLQSEFSFFYTDLVEIRRSFPVLFQRMNVFFESQLLMMEEIVRFNVARGALHLPDEKEKKKATILASLILKQILTWQSLSLTEMGTKFETDLSMADFIWQILIPYMTPSGNEEFHDLYP